MRLQEIERLKKDRNETSHYRERLLKKGKSDKAFKMQKKSILFIMDWSFFGFIFIRFKSTKVSI